MATATDIRLNDLDGTFVVVDARVLKTQASDFMLDSADRRKGGGSNRRALVHDQSDGLTVNFNGDYPGGLTLTDVAEVVPKAQNLVVRGGISYEAVVLTGDQGQGAVEGETHIVTVDLDKLLNAYQDEILKLTARVAALEARL